MIKLHISQTETSETWPKIDVFSVFQENII